jgi:hypothetical protein
VKTGASECSWSSWKFVEQNNRCRDNLIHSGLWSRAESETYLMKIRIALGQRRLLSPIVTFFVE